MSDRPLYHDGARRMQDRHGTRALADRLAERLVRNEFSEEDRDFIGSRPFFFLSTANAEGHPDCSYKGGRPGFVRVVDPRTLAFPSYDGNGMFRSLGNLLVNPHVQLLFIDFEKPRRLRISGCATMQDGDPLLGAFPGAQLVVRVEPSAIFPNCPRYIHPMRLVEESVYAPAEGHTPPVPAWKKFPEFHEVLPPGDPAAGPDEG